MGHAGLAVTFLARAGQDGQVDRDARAGGIGIEEDFQSVGELEFADALDDADDFVRDRINDVYPVSGGVALEDPNLVLGCRQRQRK